MQRLGNWLLNTGIFFSNKLHDRAHMKAYHNHARGLGQALMNRFGGVHSEDHGLLRGQRTSPKR